MLEEIKVPETEEERLEMAAYLAEQQPEDIAEYIESLSDREEQKAIIKILDPDAAAIVLFEMEDSELAGEVLLALPEEEAAAILAEMPTDDAADLLADLSHADRDQILELFEEEYADDIENLLTYDEKTAGGLMTTEFVVVASFVTVERAIEIIRNLAPDAETIYYVYVIDEHNHLVGVLSLRELIVASPDTVVSEIMWGNPISVNVHQDQEEVAHTITKYNFLAVPVVDDEDHILGIITVDDVIDVIHEEATEDIYRMAGTTAAEDEDEVSVLTAFRSRMPWLIVTIFGGFLSGNVLAAFSVKLSEVIALSFFIPMLTGLAGNVGTQSSTVTVRGIATGTVDPKSAVLTVFRESAIGVALGITVGLLVGGIAYMWQGNPRIGLVVGTAMLVNIFSAATMGTLVPILFKRINIDPAVASAPFITTTVDVMGLVNYTILATVILGLGN